MNTKTNHPLLSPPPGMPALTHEIIAHGQRVIQRLDAYLESNDNWISFSDYMRFCLYEPELGYYSSGLQKFGSGGDFITAPEISPLFGECIATALADILKRHPDWSICELGPGRGALAESVLNHLQKLEALPESYQLLEVSASLSDLQKKRLGKLDLSTKIIHLDQPPKKFKGIILANEVVDALIVERFHVDNDGHIHQVGISLIDEKLIQKTRPAPDYLKLAVNAIETELPPNYTSEICIQLLPWLNSIVQHLDEAVLLFSDYGFSQSEYYSPEREQGTLRCHYQQHAHNDFSVLPGLQDLTAWVNFTQLGDAALELGLEVNGYTTQAHFIIGSGHLQQIDLEKLNEQERFKTSKDIQTLTLPSNMGERFRFMQLNMNCDEVIPAMNFRDLRHQL